MLNPVQALMAALLCVSAKGKREKGNYSKQAHGSIQVSPLPSPPFTGEWGVCTRRGEGYSNGRRTEPTFAYLQTLSPFAFLGLARMNERTEWGRVRSVFSRLQERQILTLFLQPNLHRYWMFFFCLLLPGCHFLAWWRAPFRLKPRRFWLIKFCTNCSLSCLFRDRRFPKLTQERGREK